MAFKCKIGLHSWNGCKCSECEKTRDEQHDWSKDCEKCSKCGKTRDNQHDWTKDCEKCSTCGKSRDNQHNWSKDCEKCSKCGKTRDNQHNYSKDCEKCSLCGKSRENQHDWSGCKCLKCGKTRDEEHNWNGCKCSGCDKTRDKMHTWKGCECSKCGKTRDKQHDWTNDCNTCALCGEKRKKMHSWTDDKCSICGKEKEIVEVNLNLFDSITNDWLKILYLFLVNHAQKSKAPTFYEDIAPRMGIDLYNNNEKASFIGALRALAEVDIKAGRPILSFIAVSDKPGDQCMADKGLINYIESKGIVRDSLGSRVDSLYSYSVVFNQYWEERIPIFV